MEGSKGTSTCHPKPDANYWVVRAESGRFTAQFVTGEYAAIGWDDFGDYRELEYEELRKQIAETYEGKPQSVAANTGQVWRFVHEIGVGDYILTPNYPASTYLVGEARGEVFWKKEPTDGCLD